MASRTGGDGILDKVVDYSKLQYSKIISNDLKQMPDEVMGLISQLNDTYTAGM